MKKLTIFAFTMASLNWFALSVDDQISNYIKTYQVHKIQEMADSGLILLAQDTQKYLDQLAFMKKQIIECKKRFAVNPYSETAIPENYYKFQLPRVVKLLFDYGTFVFAIWCISKANNHALSQSFDRKFVLAGAWMVAAISGYASMRRAYSLSILSSYLHDKMFQKIMAMEGFIKLMPAVEDNNSQANKKAA